MGFDKITHHVRTVKRHSVHVAYSFAICGFASRDNPTATPMVNRYSNKEMGFTKYYYIYEKVNEIRVCS